MTPDSEPVPIPRFSPYFTQSLTPEFLEWARQQFPPIEETLAQLREVRANGGLSFEDLLRDIDVV